MALNLCEILQKVLNESVGSNEVTDAIRNHNYVEITYVDEKSNAPGKRLIQPYAYGITCAGNEALRAFQVEGDSLRGKPAWKLFLLKRMTSWRPRKQTFNITPREQGYDSAPEYNRNGDKTLCHVIYQATFDNLDDTLSFVKAQREFVQNAPKLSNKNSKGPVPFASQQRKKNVFTSQPNSRKYAQYAKNIEDTSNELDRFDNDVWAKAEAEKNQQNDIMLQNSAQRPQQTQQGPIDTKNNDTKNKDEE